MRARTLVDEYKDNAPSRTLEAIRQAVAALEFNDVAMRLYARAQCRESVPIDLVCEVIPRLDTIGMLLMLYRLADGDRIEALIHLLRTDAFPPDPVGLQAVAAFAIAANQLQPTAVQRQQLLSPVRAYASACLDQPASGLRTHLLAGFRFVASQLGDTCLDDMTRAEAPGPPAPVGNAQIALMLLPRFSREELLTLPSRLDPAVADPAVVQSMARQIAQDDTFAPDLPRNQPCWCGSGKKFKRCHGAEAAPAAKPLPSPRMLSVQDVQTCPLRDLAKMRLDQLGDQPLASVIDRLVKYRVWDLAERGLEALEKRDHIPQEMRDRVRDVLIGQAQRSLRWDLVRKHAEKLRSGRYAHVKPDVETALSIVEREPQALDHLLALAETALREPKQAHRSVGVLLKAMPALGALFLRAEIATHLDPNDTLLSALNQARAEIGLVRGDAAESMSQQWHLAKAKVRDADAQARLLSEAKVEGETLRGSIGDLVRQNRDLVRRVEELERQLRERPEPAPAMDVVAEPTELRALRAKIDHLQGVVREKNLELMELRRAARADRPEDLGAPVNGADAPPVDEDPDEDDDRWIESDGASERRIRIPTWQPSLCAEFPSIPPHIVREAIRTVAELATNEVGAWRGVKRPRRTASNVHMARIGIHYRLLFRVENTSMDVMELVTRESLLVALKRYM